MLLQWQARRAAAVAAALRGQPRRRCAAAVQPLLLARSLSTPSHQKHPRHLNTAVTAAAAVLVAAAAATITSSLASPPARSQEQEQQQPQPQKGEQEGLPLEFVEGLKAIVGEDNVSTDPDE